MNKSEQLDAWEKRKTDYANQWKTGMFTACGADPCCCCTAIFCPYCTSYALRKRALYHNMRNYICCGGFLPCSGRCGEQNCPEFCLCLETCCCFATSVMVTRWLIQDELRVQNSRCDNCLMATAVCLQQLACICQIAACISGDDTLNQLADLISFIADMVYCSVCACMQTQHKVQLDERDVSGTQAPAPGNQPMPMMQPPMQQPQPMYERGPVAVAYPAQGYQQPGYQQPGYQQPGGYGGAPQYPPPGYPTQPQTQYGMQR